MNAYDILSNYMDSMLTEDPGYYNADKVRDSDNPAVSNSSKSVYYTERTPEKYKIYAVLPGVSKDDLTAKFVDRENSKQIIVRLKKDFKMTPFLLQLEYLKNPLQIVVPADTTNPVLKLENGILEIQLDYVENTRKTEVLDIL